MVLKVPPLPAYSSQLEKQAKQIFNVSQNLCVRDFPPYPLMIFSRPAVKDSQIPMVQVETDHSPPLTTPGCRLVPHPVNVLWPLTQAVVRKPSDQFVDAVQSPLDPHALGLALLISSPPSPAHLSSRLMGSPAVLRTVPDSARTSVGNGQRESPLAPAVLRLLFWWARQLH